MCKEYGADVAINYKTTDFVTEVLSATNNRGEGLTSKLCPYGLLHVLAMRPLHYFQVQM